MVCEKSSCLPGKEKLCPRRGLYSPRRGHKNFEGEKNVSRPGIHFPEVCYFVAV